MDNDNKFQGIEPAFNHWVKNIFPNLSSEDKKRFRDSKYLYLKGKREGNGKKYVSEGQMLKAIRTGTNALITIAF